MTPPQQQTGSLRAGHETFALETALGARPDQAADAAIAAAIRAHEAAVLSRISRAADLVAASLLAEPSGRYGGHAAAITWFADCHIIALPALADADSYQPAPGDIVEVTLTGAVLTTGSAGRWTLADSTTGRRFRFAGPGRDGAPSLRVLDAARPGQDSGGHDAPSSSQ